MRLAGLSIIIVLLFTGCATIIKGSYERVLITSIPSGADVLIEGENRGKTPVSLKLNTDNNHEIIFRKDGYKDKDMLLTSKINNEWVLLDIIVLVVPVGVDWITGDWKSFEKNEIQIVMEKE